MKKLLSKTAIFLCLFNSAANARDVAINDVLGEILKNSNAKKSSEYALKASEGEASKAQKHWLPTLYIDSSAYETNDPTKTFMGNLYQRSIRTSDFDPNAGVANLTSFNSDIFICKLSLYFKQIALCNTSGIDKFFGTIQL